MFIKKSNLTDVTNLSPLNPSWCSSYRVSYQLFWRRSVAVAASASIGLVVLSGCQTSTGMQTGDPITRPAPPSTVIQPAPDNHQPALPTQPSYANEALRTKPTPQYPKVKATEANPEKPDIQTTNPTRKPLQEDYRVIDADNDRSSTGDNTDNENNSGNGNNNDSNSGTSTNGSTSPVNPIPAESPIASGPAANSADTWSASPNPNAASNPSSGNGNSSGSNDTHNSNADTSTNPIILIVPRPEQKSVQQILLEQARQNSSAAHNPAPTLATGDDIPAFRRLMDTGVKQLSQGNLSAAQSTFSRAQRLAPQSSAVYFYLAQVALKQGQYLKAEAMARRGLVVAQSEASKQALWQVILKSAQQQGNQKVIAEAQAALAR